MTHERTHAHIDDALEALARPEPPAGHVARVLASAGPEHGHGLQAAGYLRPRWALPVAASLLVAAGVTWTLRDVTWPPIATPDRAHAWDVMDPATTATAGAASRRYEPWGAPREVDRPVLPPEAYWAMDAFEEWRTLRPGTGQRAPDTGATSAHRQPATGNRHLTRQRPTPPAMSASRPAVETAAVRLAYAPLPSGLPPIELESIAPAPLAFEPLAEPAPIDLPAITLEPIVIAPLEHEEKP